MHRFRRLDVWHEAVDLAARIYELTKGYPSDERYGLTTQMRRAAISVSSNIAEGAGRGSSKDMARFLRVAIGSICELESQLEVSRKLGLVDDLDGLLSDAGLLKVRIKTLEKRLLTPIPPIDTSDPGTRFQIPNTSVPHLPEDKAVWRGHRGDG